MKSPISVHNRKQTASFRIVSLRLAIAPLWLMLADCIADPASSDAYSRDFDQNLARDAHVKDVYLRQERLLQGLDDKAWNI